MQSNKEGSDENGEDDAADHGSTHRKVNDGSGKMGKTIVIEREEGRNR